VARDGRELLRLAVGRRVSDDGWGVGRVAAVVLVLAYVVEELGQRVRVARAQHADGLQRGAVVR
jgi:hypothetical protein